MRTYVKYILKLYALSRVTGGAKGRGEHTKSLTKDDAYTPSASTKSNLLLINRRPHEPLS